MQAVQQTKWGSQQNNISQRFKLLVYFYPTENISQQTYWAFLVDERKPDPLDGLKKRILNKVVFGRYKTAIFYDNGREVERWEDGIRKN